MTEEEKEDLEDRHHELLFAVRRSVRYHTRRRMFFERWHLATSASAVVFGSATAMGILTRAGEHYTLGAALLITILAAVDLVVGTAKTARLHEDLTRRFIDLEKELEREGATEEVVKDVTIKRLEIEADEPPKMSVLDIICHNDICRAMGCPESDFYDVGFLRWTANFTDMGLEKLKKQHAAERP